jgi:hypothetical protein
MTNDYETEERIALIADGCRVSQAVAEGMYRGMLRKCKVTGKEAQATMEALMDSVSPIYQRKGVQ